MFTYRRRSVAGMPPRGVLLLTPWGGGLGGTWAAGGDVTCTCVPVLRELVLWAQNVAFGVTIVLQKLQTLAAYRASRKEANDKLAAANEQIVSSSKQVWHYHHNGMRHSCLNGRLTRPSGSCSPLGRFRMRTRLCSTCRRRCWSCDASTTKLRLRCKSTNSARMSTKGAIGRSNRTLGKVVLVVV